jgi:hypothetical protein
MRQRKVIGLKGRGVPECVDLGQTRGVTNCPCANYFGGGRKINNDGYDSGLQLFVNGGRADESRIQLALCLSYAVRFSALGD